MKSTLLRFLGVPQVAELWKDWAQHAQLNFTSDKLLTSSHVLLAVVLSCLPVAGYIFRDRYEISFDIVSVLVGLSALAAVLARRRLGLSIRGTNSWSHALRVTHTAFALGCLPLVLLLLTYPNEFLNLSIHRGEVVRESAETVARPFSVLLALGIAVWAGLTEEVIFRGMLLATLRRFRLMNRWNYRDAFAVLVAAAVFSFVHIPLWGWKLGIALFGIGCGFGVAYIVVGEALLPLIVYHALFDFIALCVAGLR